MFCLIKGHMDLDHKKLKKKKCHKVIWVSYAPSPSIWQLKFSTSWIIEVCYSIKGNFEASHDFQVFLERLKGTDMSGDSDRDSSVEEFTSHDGKSKGHVMFKRTLDEVTQSLDFFKSNFGGTHLTLACIGFDSTVSLFFPWGRSNIELKLFRKFKVTFRKFGCFAYKYTLY